MDKIKEIKKKLKQFKKIYPYLKNGCKEKIKISKKIEKLKNKISNLEHKNTEKDILINKIIKLDKSFITLKINLYKFNIEQLKKHLKRLIRR